MDKQIEQLENFQRSFKSVINTAPTLIQKEDWKLRYDLSLEELDEYKTACESNDLVEVFDSILDRLFLVFGDAVAHGLQGCLLQGFEEVYWSNMSKLDENGSPIINGENGAFDDTRPFGKVLKSKNYYKPQLKSILYEQEDIN
jgi:predicted HAD superfamily Cof-like phosphohydrolase